MTHLYIELNTGLTEEVNSSIISKLYELAISGDLDNTSDLKGRLHTTACKDIHYDYLNNNFDELYITADNIYFTLADPAVELVLATYWGDGTGITTAQISSLQHFNGRFSGNTSIQTFDELYMFPNITEINSNNRFNNCTNLRSIDLRNITKISGENGYQRWNFEYCTNLTNVGDTSNVTYFGYMAFQNCTSLQHIDISSAVTIRDAFNGCSSLVIDSFPNTLTTLKGIMGSVQVPETIEIPNLLILYRDTFDTNPYIKHVKDLGSILYFGDGTDGYSRGPFFNCSNIETVIIPETVTLIGYTRGWTKCKWVKVLSNTLPTLNNKNSFDGGWTNNVYDGKTYPIYVKDDLLTQYQSATNWSDLYLANRLRPLSQFATDFPNG